MKTCRDEALEEIWAIRRQITNEIGSDPKKRAAHYQRRQKQMGAKVYKGREHLATDK